ncbi:C40 family peptidase [Neobacillus dielmonensis]|uniref:C40 family peptidase n=1 Tax=Neobacillus dielmonensis TaxID=1347369 RepID=UPI0005AA072A|nr:C40 family peptidase [Neobacillus dielmonensis]
MHLKKWLSLLLATVVLLSCSTQISKAETSEDDKTAYVDVAVSTLWTKNGKGQTRDIDTPSLTNPVDLHQWNANMEDSEIRRWLTGKLETQALYGSKVVILQEDGDWVQVAVEGQPTTRNSLGYPGWMPKAQLTDDDRLDGLAGKPFIMVTSNTAWLYNGKALQNPFMEISFNTKLPVMKDFGDVVMVATPDDGNKFISKKDVAVYQTEADLPKITPEGLIETGKKFLGLRYLWAGVSGFGFDCSGFTYTIHKAFGVTIPRDSSVQAKNGKVIPKDQIQPGDLLFFATKDGTGSVHHVSMYLGDGLMIHAPNASKTVEIIPLATPGYINEFSGARRYWEN